MSSVLFHAFNIQPIRLAIYAAVRAWLWLGPWNSWTFETWISHVCWFFPVPPCPHTERQSKRHNRHNKHTHTKPKPVVYLFIHLIFNQTKRWWSNTTWLWRWRRDGRHPNDDRVLLLETGWEGGQRQLVQRLDPLRLWTISAVVLYKRRRRRRNQNRRGKEQRNARKCDDRNTAAATA